MVIILCFCSGTCSGTWYWQNHRVELIRRDDINGLIFHPGAASGFNTRRQRCFLGIKTKVLSSVWKHTARIGPLSIQMVINWHIYIKVTPKGKISHPLFWVGQNSHKEKMTYFSTDPLHCLGDGFVFIHVTISEWWILETGQRIEQVIMDTRHVLVIWRVRFGVLSRTPPSLPGTWQEGHRRHSTGVRHGIGGREPVSVFNTNYPGHHTLLPVRGGLTVGPSALPPRQSWGHGQPPGRPSCAPPPGAPWGGPSGALPVTGSACPGQPAPFSWHPVPLLHPFVNLLWKPGVCAVYLPSPIVLITIQKALFLWIPPAPLDFCSPSHMALWWIYASKPQVLPSSFSLQHLN